MFHLFFLRRQEHAVCMEGPCGGDLQTCASRMGGKQAPPEVLQGMDPQARGHCWWWQCLQVLGLHLFSSRSAVKQAQPDRHAEELVHLQQQCGDLKQHLRDSAEESGRQAKNVKALEAKWKQSLAALADRDSEIAQLKEQAAARSNLDSSAAQVCDCPRFSCTCQVVFSHAEHSLLLCMLSLQRVQVQRAAEEAARAGLCLLLRGRSSLHRQLQRMLLITHIGSLPAGACCSCRESCQCSRQAADGGSRKRAEGCRGGPGGAAAGAGSGGPAGADKVWNQCMSLNVATAGGHVWPCWLGQPGHRGATVLQRAEFVAMLLLLPSALIALIQVAVKTALWICTCLYACGGSVCQSHIAR